MKKVLLLFTISLVLFSFQSEAQDDMAWSGKGSSVVNIGVGLGSLYWGSGFKSTLPVNPTVSYEYGVTDKISVGAHASYSASKYTFDQYTIKESGTLIGLRGSYHFATTEKFDPYAGATLGYVVVSVTDNSGGGFGSAKGSGAGFGAFIGARYFPGSSVGFHAELGYTSFSFLTLGVSFKF